MISNLVLEINIQKVLVGVNMLQSEIFNESKQNLLNLFNNEYEVKVPFGSTFLSVFLQSDFFYNTIREEKLHSHPWAEIVIFARGRAVIKVAGEITAVEAGEAILIPQDSYHEVLFIDPNSIKCSFLVLSEDSEIKKRNLPMQIIRELLLEVDNSTRTKNLFKISSYVSFILSYFFENGQVEATRILDYSYVISEFFSRNYYKNIHTYDLAYILGVSEKHASRLVKKYTGRTFSEELTRCRISAAEQYMKEEEHSLREIAEKVGFATYSGFWKAFKRYSAQAPQQ